MLKHLFKICQRENRFLKFFSSDAREDALCDCGWKQTIEEATSKKEADILDNLEQMGVVEYKPPRLTTVCGDDKAYELSVIPPEYRTDHYAIIQKRTKHVMQQGTHNTHDWEVVFKNTQRWENPLMGWTSSGNAHSNLKVNFPTVNQAIEFVERCGWKWEVMSDERIGKKKFQPKKYADNFTYNARSRVTTK